MPLPPSMDPVLNRAVMALSALVLSLPGAAVRAIPQPRPDDVRIVRVLDGNTVVVGPYGDPFTVRLACVRSPQLLQGTAGLAARAALESLLPPGSWVTLSSCSTAADGIERAEIIPSGDTVQINLRLVQDSMAFVDRKAPSPCNLQRYSEAELNATRGRRGFWGRSVGNRLVEPPIPAPRGCRGRRNPSHRSHEPPRRSPPLDAAHGERLIDGRGLRWSRHRRESRWHARGTLFPGSPPGVAQPLVRCRSIPPSRSRACRGPVDP